MTAGLPSWGTALLRVMLGVIYVAHGYLGYAVVTVPELAGYVTRMGYPLLISELLGWYLVLAHLLGITGEGLRIDLEGERPQGIGKSAELADFLLQRHPGDQALDPSLMRHVGGPPRTRVLAMPSL